MICGARSYKDVTGSKTCTNCVARKYSLELGATHAGTYIACEAGKYLQTPGHNNASECVSTHIHTHAHTYIHTYICMCVCVCMHICIFTYRYVYMNMYLYMNIYVYKHLYA